MRLCTFALLSLLTIATPTYAVPRAEPVATRLADGREARLRGAILDIVAAARPSPAPAGRHALESRVIFVTDGTGLVIEAIAADGRTVARNMRGVDPDVLIGLIPLPSPHPTPPQGGSRIKPRK